MFDAKGRMEGHWEGREGGDLREGGTSEMEIQ